MAKKIKEIYVIYETDNFHSCKSNFVIGVCNNFNKAIKIINEACIDSDFQRKLKKKHIYQLYDIKQTQQNDFDWEYRIEKVELNTLLN
jgi:hypothetical protein